MNPVVAGAFMMATLVLITTGVTLILRGPLGRAIGRRIEGKYADPGDSIRVTELEHRVAELEGVHTRIGDLEERLDFAERLLARGRDSERLDAGRKAP